MIWRKQNKKQKGKRRTFLNFLVESWVREEGSQHMLGGARGQAKAMVRAAAHSS
jgi:hypothetical protein